MTELTEFFEKYSLSHFHCFYLFIYFLAHRIRETDVKETDGSTEVDVKAEVLEVDEEEASEKEIEVD